MRILYIAGNWKMHKTIPEAVAFAGDLVDAFRDEKIKLMVAPPFTALAAVSKALKGSNILLGAQNCAPELLGAHTGEVSALMLVDCGVQVVILGHSERRHTYLETDELVNKKVKLTLAQGLEVILCVGETEAERDQGITEQVVARQVEKGLDGVSQADMGRLTIAYEPVWAIGTGKNATPEDANAIHRFIRGLVGRLYSPHVAQNLVIQYGGSVKPNNISELLAKEHIDGALVGGASLTLDQFVPLVQYNRT